MILDYWQCCGAPARGPHSVTCIYSQAVSAASEVACPSCATLRADLARVTEERDALTAALAAERERWEKALAVVDQHVARGERVEYQREGAFGGRVVTTSRRGDLCDMRDELRRLVALMPTPTTEARP